MKRLCKTVVSCNKVVVLLIIFCFGKNAFATHFVVTSALDPIPYADLHTLRWAIDQANTNPGFDYIDFDIQGVPVPVEIYLNPSPGAPILKIIDEVKIDGSTQPYAGPIINEPKITLISDHVSLCILEINDVSISGLGGSIIEELAFSVQVPPPVNYVSNCALLINNSSKNLIKNCVFIGWIFNYINILDNSDENKIIGNYFNSNRALSTDINITTNGRNGGITLLHSNGVGFPNDNLVGGLNPNEKNYFKDVWHIYNAASNANNTFINMSFNDGSYLACSNTLRCSYFSLTNNQGANNNKPKPTLSAPTFANGVISAFSGTTSEPNDLIELYVEENAAGGAVQCNVLARTYADNNGNWTITNLNYQGSYLYFYAIATSTSGNTTQPSVQFCSTCASIDFNTPSLICKNASVDFDNTSSFCQFAVPSSYPSSHTSGLNPQTQRYYWDYGDGTPTTFSNTHVFASSGTFLVKLTYFDYPNVNNEGCSLNSVSKHITVFEDCSHNPCEECIGSFAPEKGKYILTAWVKQLNSHPSVTTYEQANILISFLPATTFPGDITCNPSGSIIDGWQRIEQEIEVPDGATHMQIILNALPYSDCLFDDIRIQPKESNMKSYVYDPITLKISAELDERNYATFYEYDEEGKLIRVKKETEKGIMTIQENKNSTVKH
jgi:hypothetical protein